ncbi:hypothetical protein AVEN_4818-1 [Araneus ventricosus]|uniref:Uncharacterized protein n=1 Tax=Araneus ventricosus TaxID=182803 RepID=A0A4Y2G884_ARAVE|nr:hypothetical protein AVEN_4818-1 [Araneus ventricosus]
MYESDTSFQCKGLKYEFIGASRCYPFSDEATNCSFAHAPVDLAFTKIRMRWKIEEEMFVEEKRSFRINLFSPDDAIWNHHFRYFFVRHLNLLLLTNGHT